MCLGLSCVNHGKQNRKHLWVEETLFSPNAFLFSICFCIKPGTNYLWSFLTWVTAKNHDVSWKTHVFAAVAMSELVCFCLSCWNWFAAKHRKMRTVVLVKYYSPQMYLIWKDVFNSGYINWCGVWVFIQWELIQTCLPSVTDFEFNYLYVSISDWSYNINAVQLWAQMIG